MKHFKFVYTLLLGGALMSCHNQYMEDYYVQPQASFTMSAKDTVSTLVSVTFTNTGTGQNYAIWTGDAGHVYGKQGNVGAAVTSNGVFSYSYAEPGDYKVVWVASSVNAKGKVESVVDSVRLVVIDKSNGIDNFAIYKVYRLDDYDATKQTYYTAQGEWVNDSTIMCPVIYEAWRNGKVNSIKSPKLALKYQLSSSKATLTWMNTTGEWQTVKSEVEQVVSVMSDGKLVPQHICVTTASGFTRRYVFAPVMMPKLTAFSINGVDATISHDLSAYNIYNVDITLPANTDLSQLQPVWTMMEADTCLLDGTNARVSVKGVEQTTGVSTIDASSGEVTYDLYYQMMGQENPELSQTAKMNVHVQVAQ